MSEPHDEQSPSSPAETPEAPAPAVEATTTDVTAAPSPAEGDAKEPPPSLLDVVKNVVEPKEEAEAPSAPEPAKTDDPAAPPVPPPEMTDAEIAALPFHNHPRFREVLSQRNALRGELGEAQTKLRQYEPDAQQWMNVREFMQSNNLSDQDVLDGFRMMALLRTDPLQGRAAIAQYLTDVDRALGLLLPDDLREDVESGYLSEERAAELAKARAATASYEAQTAEQRQQEERNQALRENEALAQRLTSAAETWENARRARDPDFEVKADLIADRMRSIAQAERLQPRTPEEITALLDRAAQDVAVHLKRFVPAARAVNRPTSASPATVAAPEPKTLREAIMLAARG